MPCHGALHVLQGIGCEQRRVTLIEAAETSNAYSFQKIPTITACKRAAQYLTVNSSNEVRQGYWCVLMDDSMDEPGRIVAHKSARQGDSINVAVPSVKEVMDGVTVGAGLEATMDGDSYFGTGEPMNRHY